MWSGATLKQNIYNVVNYSVKNRFAKTYPNINCGTELLKKTTPKFPYIRIYKVGGYERGQTFDKASVNAVSQTYQIDVFSNDKESVCEEIAEYVCEVLSKNMTIEQEPFPNYSDTSEYRYTATVSWVVGADNLIKW